MNETIPAGGATAFPAAGRYRIDPERSTITISTRHLFGLGPVRATLALRDGRIQVNDPVTGSAVWASAIAVTFRSGSDARDAAVLSPRPLDAATYPSLIFTSTMLEREPATGAGGEAGRWLLTVDLDIVAEADPQDKP